MNVTPVKKISHYIHGSSPEEQDRLSLLNSLINQKCLDAIGVREGEHILDIGSGLGQFSRLMAHKAGSAGSVTGVERDADQLKTAQSLAEANGEANLVEFLSGDAYELPLLPEKWGTYDLIFGRFVLEHLKDPLSAVRQMYKAAKKGGRVVLIDDDHSTFRMAPECPGLYELWDAYIRSYDRLGNDPFVGRHLPGLLSDAGFQPVRVDKIFYGGCSGEPHFYGYVENLAGVLIGARKLILEERLFGASEFDAALQALEAWKTKPGTAMWYDFCLAEGIK